MTRRRSRAGVLRWAAAAAFLLAISGLAAGSAGTARADSFTHGAWSGYVLIGGSYWSVSAVFTVPGGICSGGAGEYGPGSAYWVGLQGANPQGSGAPIVQTGFSLDCAGGQPEYWAWHANQVGVDSRLSEPVQPGDQVTALVYCLGSTCWQLLYDQTQNWTDDLPMHLPDGFTPNVAAVPC